MLNNCMLTIDHIFEFLIQEKQILFFKRGRSRRLMLASGTLLNGMSLEFESHLFCARFIPRW